MGESDTLIRFSSHRRVNDDDEGIDSINISTDSKTKPAPAPLDLKFVLETAAVVKVLDFKVKLSPLVLLTLVN